MNHTTQNIIFSNFNRGPHGLATKTKINYRASFDNGLTYQDVEREVLFGTFYFLGDNKRLITSYSFTILDLVSKVGGLSAIVFKAFTLWGG